MNYTSLPRAFTSVLGVTLMGIVLVTTAISAHVFQASVSGPSLHLSPESVLAGHDVILMVDGMTANTNLSIQLDSQPVRGYNHYTDSKGRYEVRIPVPASAKAGEHTVTVQSAQKTTLRETFVVRGTQKRPTLSVSPASVPRGGRVNMKGKYWYIGGKGRTVTLAGADDEELELAPLFDTCIDATCPDGQLSMGVAIPEDLLPGTYVIIVKDSVGAEASVELEVTYIDETGEPSITVVPSQGAPNATFTVTGKGFAREAALMAVWDKKRRLILKAPNYNNTNYLPSQSDSRTDTYGEFDEASATVPSLAVPGAHTITVTDDEGNRASTTFTVVRSSSSSTRSELSQGQGSSRDGTGLHEGPSDNARKSSVGRIDVLEEGETLPCEAFTVFNRPARCKSRSSAKPPEEDLTTLPCDRFTVFNRPARCRQEKSSAAADMNDKSTCHLYTNYNKPSWCRESSAPSPFSASLLSPLIASVQRASPPPSITGTYRCWSFNVGGAGKSCTSPALVLKTNGKYSVGSEKGTFHMKNGKLHLSQSKIRGAGAVSADGMRITFEYTYQNLPQTVTYLRQGGAPATPAPAPSSTPGEAHAGASDEPTAQVSVDISVNFTPGDNSIGWYNTVSLVAKSGGSERFDALAYQESRESTVLRAYVRSIPNNRVYTVSMSAGFEPVAIGTIDLHGKSGEAAFTLTAPAPAN